MQVVDINGNMFGYDHLEVIDINGKPKTIGGSTAWGSITGTLSDQTDLQSALNAKLNIPSGTTADYIDGTGNLQVFPTLTSADKMVTVGRNSTGSTLYKGTVIYILGSTGNRPNFVKAQANSEATSAGTFGVILADIPNNSDGQAVTIGTIDSLDTRSTAPNPFTTDTLLDGDTIYLSPSTPGYVTRVKPQAPNHLVYVGKVVRTSPTNGTIVYRIQNGYELDEIHDVQIISVANNDLIQWDSATSLWKNKSISAAGIQPTLVSGTNIKTINGNSVLGSGNLTISSSASWGSITGTLSAQTDLQSALNAKQATLVSGTNIKSINGYSLLGSGDLTLNSGSQGQIRVQTGNYLNTASITGTTGAMGGVTTVANRLWLYPFIPAQDFTMSAYNINVSVGVAGGLARIVRYTNTTLSNGDYPNLKAFESTSIDCSTTGTKTILNLETLYKGQIYWIGVHVSATSMTLQGVIQSSMLSLGYSGAAQNYCNITQTTTFGSLPSSFGVGAYQTAICPLVFLTIN